ncbi:MAG: ComEC/Rec2 family competence protein [Chloroflexi bacterium]|nr:ComEC/Rec2 family competence protein [Chloroflexota bacterium]
MLWMSLAAWFAISPLGAFHFNRIFTYVWLFTPLLMPLVLVTMVSGFAKLLFGLLWPSTSMILGPILGASTGALTTTVGLFSEIPGTTIYVPTPSLWWVGLYYLGLLAVLLWRSPMRPVLHSQHFAVHFSRLGQ